MARVNTVLWGRISAEEGGEEAKDLMINHLYILGKRQLKTTYEVIQFIFSLKRIRNIKSTKTVIFIHCHNYYKA